MRRRLITTEAALALIASAVVLRLLPFHITARLAGRLSSPSSVPVAGAAHAGRVGGAIARAGKVLPWNSSCLVRALAGRLMLARRRIPSTLRIGVATCSGEVRAHAWLSAGGVVICGGSEADGFEPIADFVGGQT